MQSGTRERVADGERVERLSDFWNLQPIKLAMHSLKACMRTPFSLKTFKAAPMVSG